MLLLVYRAHHTMLRSALRENGRSGKTLEYRVRLLGQEAPGGVSDGKWDENDPKKKVLDMLIIGTMT